MNTSGQGLYRFARNGNVAKVKEYLEKESDEMESVTKKDRRTLLHYAVKDEFPEICKVFLDYAQAYSTAYGSSM